MIKFIRLVFVVPFLFIGVVFLLLGVVIAGLDRAQEMANALEKLGIK